MKRSGFTLVELVIVLSIVVVLAGTLVLRVAGWTSRQTLNASARSVGNAVRTWRARAYSEERSYRLAFEGQGWTATDSSGAALGRGRLPSGHRIEDPVTLGFDGRGVTAPARIVLRNAGGEGAVVRVLGLVNDVEYAEASR